MKIGLVILGVGRWGVHFVRNFLHHPSVNLIGIVDPSNSNLENCKTKFNLNEQEIILTTQWSKIRENQNINAVVIATPASTHYSLIDDALNLGYHVLSEKPLTLEPAECVALTHKAQQKQRILFIDHTYLFHPVVKKGAEIMRAQCLGELRYGYASRTHLGPVRQDVDALWDLAIHDLAIFNYWLDDTPIAVQAQGTTWLQSGLADVVWATLTYPSGFKVYLHWCWLNTDKQRRLCIVGSQGSLIFDEMSSNEPLVLQHGYFEDKYSPTGVEKEVISVTKDEPLKNVCDQFIQSIYNQNVEQAASGKVATDLVKVLKGLSLSLQKNGEIINLVS
ncbi:oxidoreductase [Aphanothece hegewaldii CCALA 016]|uniref:Oxidoreductase n=1 Tax=Aphanothece hegewaldii CCALA 016 TaxID=2107694 RepID=A0A2T1LZ38_9CHRO|nr:Gfo/Idh/MocA family oxidoreductase [Aphanothece hegewaldii]PSF37631.1 oxidoreductase [Aphanothece hegewaldii CCALA 016]